MAVNSSVFINFAPMNQLKISGGDNAVICFDTEMVGEQRLIELSIFNGTEKEIYHSYYNPGKVREWREEIHHISREMVKDAPRFNAVKKEVQKIVDESDMIVGCALKNDVDALTHHGINGLDRKIHIEIQEWHWLMRGVDAGESLYRAHSLLSIAQDLGIDFAEEEAHGASADTLATIRCFNALKREFVERYFAGEEPEMDDILKKYNAEFERERHEFLRNEAAGHVQLIEHDGGVYSLKFNQHIERAHKKCVAIIDVADRFIAEMELKKKFCKRQLRENPELFRLKSGDIENFKSYSNEFDEERSAFCKQFTSGRLGRLTGSIHISF